MGPRGFTNPAPVTESARSALQSFYCELCKKGYSRSDELDSHEKSYDHQHKKRLMDMKAMTRDPGAAEKARKAEERANKEAGLVSIKPIKIELKSGSKPGFKKAGFKKAEGEGAAGKNGGFKPAAAAASLKEEGQPLGSAAKSTMQSGHTAEDSDDEMYDPMKPTGCGPRCPCQALLRQQATG